MMIHGFIITFIQFRSNETQEKKAVFLRFFKVPGTIFITTVSKKTLKKKGDDDHGELQT